MTRTPGDEANQALDTEGQEEAIKTAPLPGHPDVDAKSRALVPKQPRHQKPVEKEAHNKSLRPSPSLVFVQTHDRKATPL